MPPVNPSAPSSRRIHAQTSGKDLINNHLSFSLYTHTAVWEQHPQQWPRAFRCNGHIKVNGEKMSKSLGGHLRLVSVSLSGRE